MAAALTTTLKNNDFQNWLKGALAVLFAKEGLTDFVEHESTDFQRDLLQTIYTQSGLPNGTTCNLCTTANVLACPTEGFCSTGRRCKFHDSKVPAKKPNKACPNGICTALKIAILTEHRHGRPSWKNTDTRRWCSDAMEICKCFMPPDGYSDKTCLSETDFNGVLAVVINNKRFQLKLSPNLYVEPNIFTEARIIGRTIRHSPNHLLSEQGLMKNIDDLITLLSDPAYLIADANARDAVDKLRQLKTNTLTIHAEDITDVLNDSIQATFDEHQKVILLDLQRRFKAYASDTIDETDNEIQELFQLTNKQLDELKEQIKTEKDKLTEHTEQSIVLYTRTAETVKNKSIEELNNVTKASKQELEAHGKEVLEAMKRSTELNDGITDERLLKEFKEDLITYYQDRESKIPISPLIYMSMYSLQCKCV